MLRTQEASRSHPSVRSVPKPELPAQLEETGSVQNPRPR